MNKIISKTSRNEQIIILGDDNRFKTEGNSDEQESGIDHKNSLKNDNIHEIHDFEGNLKGNSVKNNSLNKEKMENFFESFFKKKDRKNLKNKDFLNIFEENDSENELFPEGDISEKCLYETLKVSSHQSSVPKTITTLIKKFSTPTNRESQPSNFFKTTKISSQILPRSSLQTNHIITENHVILGSKHANNITPSVQIPPKLNNSSFILDSEVSMLSELNKSDQQMKKLIKYSIKKNTLLNKESIQLNCDDIMLIEIPNKKVSGISTHAHKPLLIKHERIKSLDFLNSRKFSYDRKLNLMINQEN